MLREPETENELTHTQFTAMPVFEVNRLDVDFGRSWIKLQQWPICRLDLPIWLTVDGHQKNAT